MNILNTVWNFIIKQICFVDKDAYDNKVIESQKHKLRLDSIKKFIDDNNILYCIIPYFNFVNSKKRKQLFLDFINRYNKIHNLKIFVIEAALINTEFDLPNDIEGIHNYVGIYINNMIWIKENLINIALKQLPSDWNYCVWIDADITFLNNNWVNESINQLQKNDIIQLFESAINLGPTGECFKLDQGFVKQYLTSNKEYDKTHKYGYWHPGYAWGINKNVYNKFVAKNFSPLPDFPILGSGDHHMSLSFIDKADISYPNNISDEYKEKVLNYQKVCKKNGISLGYVNGTIIHHWHGSLKNRKYVERWQILAKNNYNPYTDIKYNHLGIIEFTEEGSRLIQPIIEYFNQRNEDSDEL